MVRLKCIIRSAMALAIIALIGAWGCARSGEQPETSYNVQLRSRTFTPDSGIHAEHQGRLDAALARGEPRHVFVQLKQQPTPIIRADLEAAGIRLLQFVDGSTWTATVTNAKALRFKDANVRRELPALAAVRWIGEIPLDDKLSPAVRAGKIHPDARRPDGKVELMITHFADAEAPAVRSDLETRGATIVGHDPAAWIFLVAMDQAQIRDLATDDRISWIELVPPRGKPESNRARAHIQADAAQTAGWKGQGIVVGVFEDTHVQTTNPDLSPRATQGDTDPADVNYHATMVAGMIAGNGSKSTSGGGSANQWRGVAPLANIFTYDFKTATTPTTADEHANFLNDLKLGIDTHHIDIANNSWGSTVDPNFPYGAYVGLCNSLDTAVRGDGYSGPTTIVFSGGNERAKTGTAPFINYDTLNHPKSAKNVIAVGAVDSANNLMTTYSSWGPTEDGRIKPEIVAGGHHNGSQINGVSQNTAAAQFYLLPFDYHPQVNAWYGYLGATSVSAAIASGSAALVTESWRTKLKTNINPLPSTVRAIFVHTAQDLSDATTWFNPGPDYASGYGLLRANDAINLIGHGRIVEAKLSSGDTHKYTLNVPAGTASLRLTLAWDDPPPAAAAAKALVNDLDLVVRDPAGKRYYPWTLDPAHPANDAVRTQEDHANNLEQVVVDSGVLAGSPLPAGAWTIEVKSTAMPSGPQRYSLVANQSLVGSVDVMQVLDRSGSMTSKASPAMVETKIELLRDAATQVIDLMKPNMGNRLGLVQFNQDVVLFPAGSDESLKDLTSARATALKPVVAGMVAGGTTSIGDGLQEAYNQITSAPVIAGHRRNILLVSDGMENTPSWIANAQPSLIAQGITVYSLGLGTGYDIDQGKLTALSAATGGTYRITNDHLQFKKLFAEALAGAVDWSVITDPIGEIAVEQIVEVPFTVSRDESGATANVTWEGVDGAIRVTLLTPSGKQVNAQTENRWIRRKDGAHYCIYQMDFPLAGELASEWAGTWKMVLRGNGAIGSAKKVRYTTAAHADGGVKLHVAIDRPAGFAGDAAIFKAWLTRGKDRIPVGKIIAYGDVPAVGIANVLHQAKAAGEGPSDIQGDPLTPAQRKLNALIEQGAGKAWRKSGVDLVLNDVGKDGDKTARDRIYSAILKDTRIPGNYTFRIVAEGIPAGGAARTTREWTVSLNRSVQASAKSSRLEASVVGHVVDGPICRITVEPKDAYGNYLGPSHKVSITLDRRGAKSTALTDHVDGTYSADMTIPEPTLSRGATAIVTLDGKEFAKIKLPRR